MTMRLVGFEWVWRLDVTRMTSLFFIFFKKKIEESEINCKPTLSRQSLPRVEDCLSQHIFSFKQIYSFLKSFWYSLNWIDNIYIYKCVNEDEQFLRFPFFSSSMKNKTCQNRSIRCSTTSSFVFSSHSFYTRTHTCYSYVFVCIDSLSLHDVFSLFLVRSKGKIGWRKLATAGNVI